MADVRISELPTTGTCGLTDELETNTAGGAPSVRRTVAAILAAAFVNTVPTIGFYSPSAGNIRTAQSLIVDGAIGGGTTTPQTFNGATFATVKITAGAGAGLSAYLAANSDTIAGLILNYSTATANNRIWGIYNGPDGGTSSLLNIATFNDAGSATSLVTLSRAGTLSLTGNANISGQMSSTYVFANGGTQGVAHLVTSNWAGTSGVGASWPVEWAVIGATAAVGGIGFGYDSTSHFGVIQGCTPNVGYRRLKLNPLGGAVELGVANVYIGDSSNANMTLGLTINQDTNDDEIFAFKSSDVAHGVTDFTETDNYTYYKKLSGTTGGLLTVSLTEDTTALFYVGAVTSDATAKSTSATAAFQFDGRKKSGSGLGAMGADANLLVISNNVSTKIIFDAEGDAHQDGTGWTVYDDYDDMLLADALDKTLVPSIRDPLREASAEWLRESKAQLQQLKIVHFNDDTDGVPFINLSKLGQLHNGAIRQLGRDKADRAEIRELNMRISELTSRLSLVAQQQGL